MAGVTLPNSFHDKNGFSTLACSNKCYTAKQICIKFFIFSVYLHLVLIIHILFISVFFLNHVMLLYLAYATRWAHILKAKPNSWLKSSQF